MRTIAVILARAGSKGLPDKCVRPLLGRPVIAYTIEHATACPAIQDVVLTTDSKPVAAIAREAGVLVVDRPAELASDTARVDAAVRHAVEWYEARGAAPTQSNAVAGPRQSNAAEGPRQFIAVSGQQVESVVILYGNIPVRAEGVISRCVETLERTGCSSVRTVAPVTKTHPDWIHRLDGDRLVQFRPNSIHRRQELEPLYYHDGAVIAVTRESLFAPIVFGDDPHAFFGPDRRAVVQQPEDAVDIDSALDLCLAEAVLRYRQSRV